jgi:diacylglycerol kinase family enzyme
MYTLGIISNPYAKLAKKNPKFNDKLWYTTGESGIFRVTPTLEQLDRVCEDYSARGINLIGIVGGDGSISLVLNAILKAYGPDKLPKILLLKGGTINFLASNLGISAYAESFLKLTIARLKKNKSLFEQEVSSLKVNDRLGFIFASGAAVEFLESYYKNKSGPLGAALYFLRVFFDGIFSGKINGDFKRITQPHQMLLSLKNKNLNEKQESTSSSEVEKPQPYTLLFASTVPRLPLGVYAFKKLKSLSDNEAEMIAVSATNSDLIKTIVLFLLKKNSENTHNFFSHTFKKLKILTEKSQKYSVDGDLFLNPSEEITITMGPKFVFCSPKPFRKFPCYRK